MSGIIKSTLKYIFIFLLTALLCIVLLLLVCRIPQDAIQENSLKSAEYLSQEEAFPLTIGRFLNSRGDNYADSNLLNVVYNVDADNTFRSMIEAPYYRVEGESAQDNFYETVAYNKQPNTEYSRYWHGSQVFIRPLLTVMSIEGIRPVLFCLLMALNLWLIISLLRRKQYCVVCIYVLGLILSEFWMCAASLEYIMPFLVMAACCVAVTHIHFSSRYSDDTKNNALTYLFIASGTITCFLDFLTTETLTFTIPFLLYLLLRKSNDQLGSFREEFYRMVKYAVVWFVSYALMFVIKWGLILITLGYDAFQNALQSASVRIDGSITMEGLSAGESGSVWQQLSGALLRNLACLFPVTANITAANVIVLTFACLVVFGALFYLFRKDPVDSKFIGLVSIVALIPYARYLCLSNHSYIHYFFTYRAQMVTIMALLGILLFSIRTVPRHSETVTKKLKRKK